MNLKSVHFGAGNIGRGFIGLVLNRSGYHVTFVDINDEVISALKKQHAYQVEVIGEEKEVLSVDEVDGYNSINEAQKVNALISEADLITTAVGTSILPVIATSIVSGIKKRIEANNTDYLNIIACENAIGGTDILKEAIYKGLTKDEQSFCDEYIGFPNSAVDRIVPNQSHEDPLYVMVEPFFEWVIERKAVKGELNDLQGVKLADDLTPYIERKLFTVNTGHATCAYVAYHKGYDFIPMAMKDEVIKTFVLGVLDETGAMLCKKYGFDSESHKEYIQKTMKRFANPEIKDEITRVARAPKRKVGPNDRFVKPLNEALTLNLRVDYLTTMIGFALAYDHNEDEEAQEIQKYINEQGIQRAITNFTGIKENNPAFNKIKTAYININSDK
ncbi:mannitol-1-phosphate 5-dehydrogenase [Haloplasma contractile]|uniref:Mannitol-1-phosphate 5-dehydrogenase n=1 Tax=Haloplasma contractile SSD-17B TaxID=1033810 RepID=F7PV35_9MOLU|nr:mannitol-1-phosphate 5-dehydrogenase [Haloplasma contractile]ERJ11269.1 Mannitol-1-phosphate 5-dehydrogenase protein [Haloplasma contractile SSD-17B]